MPPAQPQQQQAPLQPFPQHSQPYPHQQPLQGRGATQGDSTVVQQQAPVNVVNGRSGGQPQQGVAVGSRQALTKTHLLVSKKQRGNPLLSYVRNCPVAYDDGLVPDYSCGNKCIALFLSVKYHLLHPDYLGRRIKEVQQADRRYSSHASAGGSVGGSIGGSGGMLKVVLCLCDNQDPVSAIAGITKIMLPFKWTLLCAWSNEEAARYLETFKKMENANASSIQEKGGTKDQSKDGHTRAVACLTSIRSVNKTDAAALLATFGSVAKVMMATAEELSLVPGMGPTKVKNLHRIFNTKFGRAADPVRVPGQPLPPTSLAKPAAGPAAIVK